MLGGLSVNSPASMFSEPIDYQTRVAAKIEQSVIFTGSVLRSGLQDMS